MQPRHDSAESCREDACRLRDVRVLVCAYRTIVKDVTLGLEMLAAASLALTVVR
jgi:hypothetical protein